MTCPLMATAFAGAALLLSLTACGSGATQPWAQGEDDVSGSCRSSRTVDLTVTGTLRTTEPRDDPRTPVMSVALEAFPVSRPGSTTATAVVPLCADVPVYLDITDADGLPAAAEIPVDAHVSPQEPGIAVSDPSAMGCRDSSGACAAWPGWLLILRDVPRGSYSVTADDVVLLVGPEGRRTTATVSLTIEVSP